MERVSRYRVMIKNRIRHSRPITDKIITAFSPLPSFARRSSTFDRGTEFSRFRALEDRIGARSWFCDPNSPWQKGAVENANKRIRRFIPGDTDLSLVSQKQLVELTHQLNSQPRKRLGYKTPAEVFTAHLRKMRPGGFIRVAMPMLELENVFGGYVSGEVRRKAAENAFRRAQATAILSPRCQSSELLCITGHLRSTQPRSSHAWNSLDLRESLGIFAGPAQLSGRVRLNVNWGAPINGDRIAHMEITRSGEDSFEQTVIEKVDGETRTTSRFSFKRK